MKKAGRIKKWTAKVFTVVVKYIPLAVCICFAIWYLINRENIDVDTILNYAPSNLWLAAVFMIVLYTLKSLSIVFPIILLHITGGFLFPPFIALLVNGTGVMAGLTVAYWIGRISGGNHIARLRQKHPQIADVISHADENTLSISFFLRFISCLPGDLIGMCFGAAGVPFKGYLLGSLLGSAPGIIAATMFGASATQSDSPMFWISIFVIVCISVISFLFYFFWKKQNKGSECE